MQKSEFLSNTKSIFIAIATSLVLALGFSLATSLSASAQDCNGVGNCDAETTTEDSPTNNGGNQANNGGEITTYEVNGNCSGIFNVSQSNSAASNQANTPISTNVGSSSSSSQNTTQNQSTAQSNSFNFSPNCASVTNVSQTSASAGVSAPRGSVNAGGGSIATASAFGTIGSVLSMGLGLAVRARQML